MRKRVFQILLILGVIYFLSYIIPTTSYWVKDCGMLRFTDFDHFDSECSVGLWAVVYLIYGIPAWILFILAIVFYFKWKHSGDENMGIEKNSVDGRGLRILGIISSLVMIFPFLFERIANHLFFKSSGILVNKLNYLFLYFRLYTHFGLYAFYILYNLFIYLFLFFPLYYCAWKKEPKNKYIKIWAKISTITIPIYITLRIIDNFSRGGFISSGWSVWFAVSFVIALGFLLLPLYYYAWRKTPNF